MQYEISGSVLAGQITTTTWAGAPSRTWAWSRAIGGAGRGIGGAGQFASWTRAAQLRTSTWAEAAVARATARMAEYQDRQERLEDAAANAREVLAQHRSALGNAGEIAEYAREMDDFLDRSELTERRAFIESFVREILVMPGQALLRYTFPMPDDSPIPGKLTERVALDGSALSSLNTGAS